MRVVAAESSLGSGALRRFPRYGLAGLAIVLFGEILLAAPVYIIGVYFTPIQWTGYILLVDAAIFYRSGSSLISSRRKEFLAMLPWSVACWLIFEAYNLRLHNWSYVGLPENAVFRNIGYAWSFATIFPAVLETAELIALLVSPGAKSLNGGTAAAASMQFRGGPWSIVSILLGVLCLAVPLVVPESLAAKMFGLVWIGFVFLLDPLNALVGGRALFARDGVANPALMFALGASGLVCGILWEFWNYWAIAKWIYTVPISFAGPKLFEMPLLGFLGFIPFALECYVMQQFLLSLVPSISSGLPA